VRLNIELINSESGDLIWRDAIEETYENSFKLQDIISEKIISGLEIQFSPSEKEINNAIFMMPIHPAWNEFFKGAIIILVVLFNRFIVNVKVLKAYS